MTIQTLLIANRGEISRRVIRTCRELGIGTVAVFSDADQGHAFVQEADRAVRIGGAEPAQSYLNAERLLEAAARTGADAVHPGYGFLSENAEFARRVEGAGLLWVGPPPEAIEAMADKAAARKLAAENGIPTVPGFHGSQDDEALAAAAAEIGFPVLIKALAGGGGRGMRRVDAEDAFAAALASARREAISAFGRGDVLIERYVSSPRHIEVQVLADAHGNCVHLFERECSIQRRHQKIVEEAPSPGVSSDLRALLGRAAVQVAQAAGYVGAGTVEFLVEGETFWFLEMNTRLQVEHPVTEEVTGLDLVALQIAIAEGAPLPFGQADLKLTGHSIEVRVYAEDPLRNWMPAAGTLLRVDIPAEEGIRVDAGYRGGDTVPSSYDAMLAKVIATGPDRKTASRRLSAVLRKTWMPGLVNNLPLLRQIVSHDLWHTADLDTHFLDRAGLPQSPPLNLVEGVVAATVLGWCERRDRYPGPTGWRLHGYAKQVDHWRCGEQVAEVTWSGGAEGLTLSIQVGASHTEHEVRVRSLDGDQLELEVDGLVSSWRVARHGEQVYVHTGQGEAFVQLEPRFPLPSGAADVPGAAVAPTVGTVTAVSVSVGDAVVVGQPLVAIEAMKMEHSVVAGEAGVVLEVRVSPGDAVDEGMLVVRIEPEEGSPNEA
jgi:acetyl/propionyl-CoA carboxylase alpha subunit